MTIALLSSAIVYNAVFAQKNRVYSDSGISIAANSSKLDKLFSVLNVNQDVVQPGRTRVNVQPGINDAPEPQSAGSAQVRRAQRELAQIGKYSGPVNGILGLETSAAIKQYQRDNGLPQTGRTDHHLVEQLEYVRRIQEATTITGSLDHATDGASIELAQIELQRLGYQPGPVDGKLGLKTIQALRWFQTDLKIPADGKITPGLLDLMASTDPR